MARTRRSAVPPTTALPQPIPSSQQPANAASLIKALDPYTDGTPGWSPPVANAGALFRDVGSSGLRQFGGWVREEFLQALQGREAQRVFREMGDNSAVVGAVLFAITQAMRKVDWREEPASSKPDAMAGAEFARSLREDMSQPWEDHVVEALSMLQYGFAPCEIVYKRRLGERDTSVRTDDSTSMYDDGKIGIRRLPLRGQETILKWFFDANGQVTGLTQQPWVGSLIDLPIEKFLLYRPSQHKNNPEGRSILRTSYRPWYFMKRVEELEAILFERMGGLPVVRVPNALLEAAGGPTPNAAAQAALDVYKKLAQNVRADEQMGIVMPSDTWRDANGSPTSHKMYDFELKTPDNSALRVDSDKTIRRYNVDILKSVLADFIDLGHQARGTQNLAISKVDMFYTAIEGWLNSMSAVQNSYLLPRVWYLNSFTSDSRPKYLPDLPQRIDLDVLGKFILAIAQAGMPMFPDPSLENYIRGAAGMPEIGEGVEYDPSDTVNDDTAQRIAAVGAARAASTDEVVKHILGLAALERRRALRESERPYQVNKLTGSDVDRAALAAHPNPTLGQREAGNYPKGHLRLHGMDFSIETARGTPRTGVGKDGQPWRSIMPAPYGYVRRRSPGADGDALDVYFGPEPDQTTVYVIDQLDADTGEFDEHKLMVGFPDMGSALDTYRRAFSDGRGEERIGAVNRVSIDGLKTWSKGDTTGLPVGSLVGKSSIEDRLARLEERNPGAVARATARANGHLNGHVT